jgi:hypothetical protein
VHLPFIVKRDGRTHARLLLTSLDPKISLSNIEYRAPLHAVVAHASVPLLLSSLKSSVPCAFTPILPQIECVGILYLLPHRHHDFHLGRVDRWLESNASCLLFYASVDSDDTSTRIIFGGGDATVAATGSSCDLFSSPPSNPERGGQWRTRGSDGEVGGGGTHKDPMVRWGLTARIWPPSPSPSRADLASLLPGNLARFFFAGSGSSPSPW